MRNKLFLSALMLVFATGASAQNHPIFDATGIQDHREYFSQLPFEHIDTATGGLTLTFTDLVLPGNAGRDLRFQRTYNSKTGSWTFGPAGVPLQAGDTWPNTDFYPVLLSADGGQATAATPVYPADHLLSKHVLMTDRSWKYYRSSRILWMPDGTTAQYANTGFLESTRDAVGNVVEMEWAAQTVTVTQRLGSQETRKVTLHMPAGCTLGSPNCVPTSMTYEGRTWTYVALNGLLREAQPPAGASWRYEYGNPLGTIAVITPHGGRVTYEIEGETFEWEPGQFVNTWVVRSRQISGFETPWVYTYQFDTTEFLSRKTFVDAPDGTRTTFEHELVRAPASSSTNGALIYAGRTFLLKARTVEHGGEPIEREEREYQWVPIPSARATDSLPELSVRRIVRGGNTYTTTIAYRTTDYGDFHRPWTITESCPAGSRTTTRTYVHSNDAPISAPYIVGMLTQESVSSGGQTLTSSWTYDAETGFRTSETRSGITTQFTNDGKGNVATVTKGNGNSMSFTYIGGVVETTTTSEPGYTISREINVDGTVKSETRGGIKTTYEYDDIGRVKLVAPQGSNPMVTGYDDANRTITTSRGAAPTRSEVLTTLDGFGRVIETLDSADVQTVTEYDVNGRPTYVSLPFSGTRVGTEITYDALGRVKKERHEDNTFRLYTYSGDNVTIADENDHKTTLTREAFGHPDNVRVIAVTDAATQRWDYTLDVAGNLRQMAGPNGVTRTWAYGATNLLESETHPESGTTTYSHDGAGIVSGKTDANGQATNYVLDGNDRVKKVTAGSRVTDIVFEPGADRVATTTVAGVTTTMTYDTGGRLRTRTDSVDGKSFTVTFDYDGNDNVKEITYPSGRKVAYEYGAENQLTRVFKPGAVGSYASGFDYHPSGALKAYTAGNGVPTTIGYDQQRYWVTSIQVGNLMTLGYLNYDGVGNVGTITDSRGPGKNQTFTYDVLDRLKAAASGAWSDTFDYDAHGNRQGANFVYNPTNRFRLESFAGLPMSYRPNGNLESGSNAQFWYTPDNLMDVSQVGGTTTRFAYDADTWRVKKSVDNGPTTYYVRGPNGELLMEWVNTSPVATVHEYIYAGSRLIAVMKGDVPPK